MTITAIIILVAYLACVLIVTKEIPLCLSDTAYTVSKTGFAIVMVVICGLLWFPMLEATAEEWQFLVFLSMVGMMAMAVSPYEDDKISRNIHYTGTTLAMICVLLLWLTKGKYQIPVVVFTFGIVSPCMTRRWLLIVELMMFASAFIYSIDKFTYS